MRKLVLLDDETWGFTEIDQIRLRRATKKLHAWLKDINPENDPFKYLKYDLPLVQAVLAGTMKFPYRGFDPHSWEIGEGTIPREYINVSSPFYNTIRGEHYVPPEIIEHDGKRYAWAIFEDPEEGWGSILLQFVKKIVFKLVRTLKTSS